MLEHSYQEERLPERVIILGSKGFVASSIKSKLERRGVLVKSFSKEELDLTQSDASKFLISNLNLSDSLVFVSAKAPVKNEEMLLENLQMAKTVCEVFKHKTPAHLVYLSSDAVYADSNTPISESSNASPDSLHGIMHLTREVMLKNAYNGPFCILRPTLIYGDGDPHNGYGPNRFLRLADAGEEILLFGEGEERRDHVWIEDVAEIGARILLRKSKGIVNLVSGEINSFCDIADKVRNSFNNAIDIKCSERIGPMPHNGYREFDDSVLSTHFPDLKRKSVMSWIASKNQ